MKRATGKRSKAGKEKDIAIHDVFFEKDAAFEMDNPSRSRRTKAAMTVVYDNDDNEDTNVDQVIDDTANGGDIISATTATVEAYATSEEGPYTGSYLLCNRLLLCGVAVALLWATSLQICVAIVGVNINVPLMTSVIDSCRYALTKVNQQREQYKDCAKYQLITCQKQLAKAYSAEQNRVHLVERENERFRLLFDSVVTNCSASYQTAIQAINGWSASNPTTDGMIPYYSNCSSSRRSQVQSLIGNSATSKSTLLGSSEQYSKSSDEVVFHLVDYTASLSAYNQQYIHNKTAHLKLLSEKIVEDVSLPRIQSLGLSFDPISNILDDLLSCGTLSDMSTLHPCPFEVSLHDIYSRMSISTNARLRGVTLAFADMQATFNRYVQQVEAAISAADGFYDSIEGPQGLVTWVYENTNIPQLCGTSTPNFCTFSKVDWYVHPPVLPSLPSIPTIPDPSVLWDQVQAIEALSLSRLHNLSFAFNVRLKKLVPAIRLGLIDADFSPKDYDPPKYPYGMNYSDEKRAQSQRSKVYKVKMNNAINHANKTAQLDQQTASSKASVSATSLSDHIVSTFTTTYAAFQSYLVDFGPLIESVLTLQGLLYLFDYIYRGFYTIKTISQFWNRGVVFFPKTDLQAKHHEVNTRWFAIITWVFRLMPFIGTQLLILVVFLFVVIWTIASILVPEYHSYSRACVQHTSNDTYISRNLYSAALDYAAMDGNEAVIKGILQYNVMVQDYCSSNIASTLISYNSMFDQLYQYNSSLSNTRYRIALLEGCVHLDKLSAEFQAACCGHTDYYIGSGDSCKASPYMCPIMDVSSGTAYMPPQYYLRSATCSESGLLTVMKDSFPQANHSADQPKDYDNAYGTLQFSAFQCSKLPPCIVTCDGPDEALISYVTKHCSCVAEWFFNGYLVTFAVAVLVYLLLNISRILMIKGAVIVFWRLLTPAVFDYKASCDSSGRTIYEHMRRSPKQQPEELIAATAVVASCSEKGKQEGVDEDQRETDANFENILKHEITSQMTKFHTKGIVMVLVGLLLNVPWIAALILLQSNLEYKQ